MDLLDLWEEKEIKAETGLMVYLVDQDHQETLDLQVLMDHLAYKDQEDCQE